MEASDQTQDPGATGNEQDQSQAPTQDSGQPDANSQEQPADESNLTTPQPDQPVQPETERQPDGVTATPGPSGEPAEGTVSPDPAARQNLVSEEAQREYDRGLQRQEHAQRTGGGEVQPNELQNARQEHNDRTGGGEVPGAESEPVDRGE